MLNSGIALCRMPVLRSADACWRLARSPARRGRVCTACQLPVTSCLIGDGAARPASRRALRKWHPQRSRQPPLPVAASPPPVLRSPVSLPPPRRFLLGCGLRMAGAEHRAQAKAQQYAAEHAAQRAGRRSLHQDRRRSGIGRPRHARLRERRRRARPDHRRRQRGALPCALRLPSQRAAAAQALRLGLRHRQGACKQGQQQFYSQFLACCISSGKMTPDMAPFTGISSPCGTTWFWPHAGPACVKSRERAAAAAILVGNQGFSEPAEGTAPRSWPWSARQPSAKSLTASSAGLRCASGHAM